MGCGGGPDLRLYSLLLRRVPPFANDAVGLFCLVSGLVCLAAHGLWEPEVSVRTIDWLWLALLGLGPMGASFFLWNHAMRHGDRAPSVRWPISPAAVDLAAGPVGGASLGPLTVLAGVLIVGGAVLGNLSGRRAWAVSCSPPRLCSPTPRRWPDALRGPPRAVSATP